MLLLLFHENYHVKGTVFIISQHILQSFIIITSGL